MKAELKHNEIQSRTTEFKKNPHGGISFVDNRNTLQAKQIAIIQRAQEQQAKNFSFVDNRNTAQMKLASIIQRVGVEDEALQMKPITQMKLEDDELQMKPIVQLQSTDDDSLQGKFETILQKPNNTGLPDNLKLGVESLSGFSMDDVRVHYNSDKPTKMQAHAYAQGTDIHVAPGQEKHLPHEAWHVVQQKQGRVQPTMQIQGLNMNGDVRLESEADTMGNKIVQRYLVSNDHVAADLLHKKANSLFNNFADWSNAGLIPALGVKNRKNTTTTNVANHRKLVDYKHIYGKHLLAPKCLHKIMLSKKAEIMYVHHKNKIYTADRNENKLPHPTLVGGDPNVKCAGTLILSNKKIVVTTNSGHFRPTNVPQETIIYLKEIAVKIKPKHTVERGM